MTLEEVLELLNGAGLEDEQRGILSDSIKEMHDGLNAGAQAKIAQLEEAVAEANKANDALKAQNYDLLVASTAKVEDEPTEEDKAMDAKKSIDDLFKEA